MRKSSLGLFASFGAGLALVLVSASALPAQPRSDRGPDRGGGCAVFEHADYDGAREFFRDGTEIAWVGEDWNDRVSAVRCSSRCTLTAFEDIDYGGARERFRDEVAFVGPEWNDRISALRVDCGGWGGGRDGGPRGGRERGPDCALYEHADYAGRRLDADEGHGGETVPPDWNDLVSSVQCRPGCEIEAFEHVGHGGQRQTWSGSVAFVGPHWNDRLSSYRVTCRR